jgi:hypothetical protein
VAVQYVTSCDVGPFQDEYGAFMSYLKLAIVPALLIVALGTSAAANTGVRTKPTYRFRTRGRSRVVNGLPGAQQRDEDTRLIHWTIG